MTKLEALQKAIENLIDVLAESTVTAKRLNQVKYELNKDMEDIEEAAWERDMGEDF